MQVLIISHVSVIITNTSLYLFKIRVVLDLSLLFIYLAYDIHTRVITIKKKINFPGYRVYRNSRLFPFFFFLVVGIPGLFPIFPWNGIPGKADSYFSSYRLRPLARNI